MGRPPLPIGTWGKIRRDQLGPNQWRARAKFRDYDGETREVEAHGTTGAKAENKLREMLRDRATPNSSDITANTLINALFDLWFDEITGQEGLSAQTRDRYRSCYDQAIRKPLGKLRIRETTVGRLDKFFKTLAKAQRAQAHNAKVVLKQMLAMAVRHGAISTNPIRDIASLPSRRRTVVALATDDLESVRAAILRWQEPVPGKSGPHHTSDLADIIDLLLATGARIGEILAIRWQDLDLDSRPTTLTISGTLVYVKGKGLFRQDWTKTDAGFRVVVLPQFATRMLARRLQGAVVNDLDAVFTTRNGTWLSPNNVRRQWRQARADTGLEWVTPHSFRKTVATLLDREGKGGAATLQLGHSNEDVTKEYYIVKATVAPDVTEVLDKLGPNHPDGTDSPAHPAAAPVRAEHRYRERPRGRSRRSRQRHSHSVIISP
ncbi:tyrosine-type recombinase/integrase [Actinoplanes sp. NPDC051343]|uniref:tyrosine-type recombinase/integrase n=1 Tax=Actinoplanes sp. NPDC051343 TaxID=3363906 RepID=UPI003791B311